MVITACYGYSQYNKRLWMRSRDKICMTCNLYCNK